MFKTNPMKIINNLLYFFITLIFLACNTPSDNIESNIVVRNIINGNAKYGGELNLSEEESFNSIFPAKVIDVTSAKIVSQIHNGLVKFDTKDLSILPSIAKDWEINEDETQYTFNLRNNVFFHDDPCFKNGKGRKVTAQDFKFSLELLCNAEFENSYNMINNKIIGTTDLFNKEASELKGVEVINDTTLIIKLDKPLYSFIFTLAMPNLSVIAKEAYEAYGIDMKVGTGAFKFTESKNELKDVYLIYNENYYLSDTYGNKLPYLDSIHFRFGLNKNEELESFKNNKLSLIHGLPANEIAVVVSESINDFKNSGNKPPKTILGRKPELATQYYEFNILTEPFNDIRVRKAFNYAIDRQKILDNALNGQGNIGRKGITPIVNLFSNYNYDEIKGYDYNPELARKLLAEAGYPNGENFPNVRLELNLGGNLHLPVAEEVQQQLYNTLNVSIEFEQVSFKDKLEHSKYGKSEMFRSAWVADYPSPETFLSIFYGASVPESMEEASYPNTTRYTNATFDSLYLKGLHHLKDIERCHAFSQAEKILMEDAPIMILWYQEDYMLYTSSLKNFFFNSMMNVDLSEVYLNKTTDSTQTSK